MDGFGERSLLKVDLDLPHNYCATLIGGSKDGRALRTLSNFFHYRPQRSRGKVMFSQGSQFCSRGEGCIPACIGADTARVSQHALGQTPPPPGRLLLRTVRILLECILVFLRFCSEIWGYLPLVWEFMDPLLILNTKFSLFPYEIFDWIKIQLRKGIGTI